MTHKDGKIHEWQKGGEIGVKIRRDVSDEGHDCLTREHDPDEWCPDCFVPSKGRIPQSVRAVAARLNEKRGRDSGEQTSPSEAEAGSSSLKAVASTRPAAANPAACPVCGRTGHAEEIRLYERIREPESELAKQTEPKITETESKLLHDLNVTLSQLELSKQYAAEQFVKLETSEARAERAEARVKKLEAEKSP